MDLTTYQIILINSSGGKDSQAMLDHVHKLATEQGVVDRLVVVHADLGRVEWAGTKDLARTQAEFYDVRFEAIARPEGDLLAHVKQRGMWPDSARRYCTSDHKRGQVGKVITKLVKEKAWMSHRLRYRPVRVLNCLGLRAQESSARAKKVELETDARQTNGRRHVDTWLPLLRWSEADVWANIKASGAPYHRAYDLGMPRLSCVFCVFAPKAALVIAGTHNPELLAEYVQLEQEIGHKFTARMSIAEVQLAVDAGETGGSMDNWTL
jgi:3'-phosphoadenosine 5'-phosphosulfate sulfotransferase (PAPS reductase)/FAD synthetase